MSLWLLIIGALTLQEGLSTTAVLLTALHDHYSLWAIHAIWLLVTLVQIYAGYFLGKWIQSRFDRTKVERFLERYAHKLEETIGKRGEEVALILGAAIVSPAATALLASWLDISLFRIVIFTLIGDFLWYLSEWATVIGATQLMNDVKYGSVVLVVLAVLWLVLPRYLKRKAS